MSNNTTPRWGVIAALVAGGLWCIASLLSLAIPDPTRYLDALVFVPFSLTLVAVIGLHQMQRDAIGRLGRIAFWVSVIAMSASLVGLVGIIADTDALKWLGFPLGAAGWLIGFALYGIATARAGRLPRWVGAAIALSQPLTVLLGIAFSPISPLADYGNYTGALAHGLIWLAIGRLLLKRQPVSMPSVTQRPASRVA